MRKFALLVWVVVFSGWSSGANAVTIDFDDVSTTSTIFVDADHYRSEGIVFDRTIPIQDVTGLEPWFLAPFNAGGGSGLAMALTGGEVGFFSIGASFVVPGTAVAATTSFVSFDVFDSGVGSSMGTLEAFDSIGNPIGSVSQNTPSSMYASYSIAAPGIASIRITASADGESYDNLSFGSPIPEPSTALLLGVGLAGLGMRRRQRTHRRGC